MVTKNQIKLVVSLKQKSTDLNIDSLLLKEKR